MTDPLAEQHLALVAYRDLDRVGCSMLLTYRHERVLHYIIINSYWPHLISQKRKEKKRFLSPRTQPLILPPYTASHTPPVHSLSYSPRTQPFILPPYTASHTPPVHSLSYSPRTQPLILPPYTAPHTPPVHSLSYSPRTQPLILPTFIVFNTASNKSWE